jgi:vacuolar-type H+-ATPase subunit I/STV1
MSEKDGFIDSLKHMVFEDEPEKQEKPTRPVNPSPAAAVPTMASFNRTSYTPNVADNDEVYSRILAKTDFNSTEIGATIQKFLAPLVNLPMDASLKFKTAVAQAKAQTSITEDGILSTFDSLKNALSKEQDSFAAKAKQYSDREITGRSAKISEITAQINQLQQELGQLSTELVEAQGKAARAQGQFSAAIERRSIEIDQQKAQFAALLK